jgi:hypothetical protein
MHSDDSEEIGRLHMTSSERPRLKRPPTRVGTFSLARSHQGPPPFQPGSALRELISNAYDADATRVVMCPFGTPASTWLCEAVRQ